MRTVGRTPGSSSPSLVSRLTLEFSSTDDEMKNFEGLNFAGTIGRLMVPISLTLTNCHASCVSLPPLHETVMNVVCENLQAAIHHCFMNRIPQYSR